MIASMGALLHMLGLDADHRVPWRNYYVTSADDPEIDALVSAGLAEPTRRPGFLDVSDRVYRATEAGKIAAMTENRRRNPPPSPAKRRYLAWLRLADAWPDLTFADFLRRRLYDPDVLDRDLADARQAHHEWLGLS